MARRRAGRAKHRIARIVRIDLPVGAVMFGDAPAMRRGHAGGEHVEDAAGAGQEHLLARRLVSGQKRLDPMHVGVHAAIAREGRPVAVPFVAEQPRPLFPEMPVKHLAHIGDQARRIGMADLLRAGAGQQHEDMAVSQLAPIGDVLARDAPDIAAMAAVAVMRPQVAHALIDDLVGAGHAKALAKRIGMHQPRRAVQLLQRARQRLAVIAQRMKPALGVQAGPEKAELLVGLGPQPGAVVRILQPGSGRVAVGQGHAGHGGRP